MGPGAVPVPVVVAVIMTWVMVVFMIVSMIVDNRTDLDLDTGEGLRRVQDQRTDVSSDVEHDGAVVARSELALLSHDSDDAESSGAAVPE